MIRFGRAAGAFLIPVGLTFAPHAEAAVPTGGAVKGKVTDAATGAELPGVNVTLKGTWLGAVSGARGEFLVDRVPAGSFVVEASLMGYEKRSAAVEIRPGDTATVAFRLKASLIKRPAEVVTASKRKQAIEDAPATVEVVSSSEIRARNATTLDQVLANTAGMGITDGQIDLRGSTGFNWAAGSRVLLLMDGHPLINGDTGGINWDAIPIEEVERVEVVKGAGSALYGSNAMAGMVNVITRDPSPVPETRVRLTYGFYDTPAYDAWRWTDRFLTYRLFEQGKLDFQDALAFNGLDFSHSRSVGKTGFGFTLGRKTSNGYHQNGDYKRWNAMGKVKVRMSERESLTLSANWTDNRHGELTQWLSQSRPLETPASELGNSIAYSKASAAATYRRVRNASLAYTAKANWYRTYWKNDYQDNHDYARTNKFGAEAQIDLLWRAHAFTFGGEAILDRAHSMIYGNPETYDLAAYAEDEVKCSPRLTATLGARLDYHRVTGVYGDGEANPRMGLVFRPSEGTSVRLSAGHGFRAPSIAEVFADITVSGIRVVKNLNLREAERAWSFELGASRAVQPMADRPGAAPALIRPFARAVSWLEPSFLFDAAVFGSLYKNMIDVDFNPAVMAFQFMNMGRARTSGLELKARMSVRGGLVSGQAGYTYLDAKDLDDGTVLHYRSKHRLNAGAEVRVGKRLTFGMDVRYASRIETVANLYSSDERVPMHVMDARILYDLGSIDLALECNNVRNYHYTLRQRFLEPVRHFVLTVRSQF